MENLTPPDDPYGFKDETPVTVAQGKINFLYWELQQERNKMHELREVCMGIGGMIAFFSFGGLLIDLTKWMTNDLRNSSSFVTVILAATGTYMYFKGKSY